MSLETRYLKAIKDIGGTFALLSLPDGVKEVLKGNYDLKTKVEMLELVASGIDVEKEVR